MPEEPIAEKKADGNAQEPLVLAAITAAIMAYMEQEKKKDLGMIHRSSGQISKVWAQAGRNELMNHRIL